MLSQTRREYRAGQRRVASRPRYETAISRSLFSWTDRQIRTLIVVGFAALFVGTTSWLVWHVAMVTNDLKAAQAALSGEGDIDERLETMGAHAASAAEAATDPIWRAAELFPLVGDNLHAVRASADAVDLAVNEVALPILATRDDATNDEQSSDTGLLAQAIPVMQAAAPAAAAVNRDITAVADSPFIIAPVRDALETVLPVIGTMDSALQAAPTLLGADGTKNYLLVFQNNAESLPLGGSAASQTLISVEDGTLSIVKQANSGSFKIKPSLKIDVDQSAIDLYSNYLVSRVNTAVARPDFETAAAILTAFWNRDIDDTEIDGVISINPLVLPGVLDATGPMTVNGIELTSDNVVQVLLSDAYAWWGSSNAEAKKADTFFAKVAALLFERVATGDFDPVQMLDALSKSAETGDILIWSSDPTINDLLVGTRMSGVMPTDNTEQTIVGVYFFDHSGGSKIDYYMESAVSLSRTCASDVASYTSSTTLHLDLTQEAANTLPFYVKSKNWGATRTRTGVYVYGPPGTTVESVSVDGLDIDVLSTDIDDLGRPVAAFDVNLAPDQSATVTASFTGADIDNGPLTLWSTPMVNTTEVTVDDLC